MTADFQLFDPLLGAEGADAMLALCERYGRYVTYAEDVTAAVAFAPEIPQRYDAAADFVRTGGRLGRREPPGRGRPRRPHPPAPHTTSSAPPPPSARPETRGMEPFLHHEGFREAARRVHGRPVVVPNIVYANLLLPGQELALHTDVPEFRGANRKRFPQWLIVVMHHSGLFEPWRMPLATAGASCGSCEGGAFAFYPDGPDGPVRTLPVKHDTGVLVDTDSVFHGVDREEAREPLPQIRSGTEMG